MLPPFQLEQVITRTVREEWGRILATLVRSIGDFQLAEDALQDATELALQRWPQDGLPASPPAWLLTTARRRAIDRLRRNARYAELQQQLVHEWGLHFGDENDTEVPEGETDMDIPDKRLELIFTCCHPALDRRSQVALTLRTLGGLDTDEIARAFLDKRATTAQRLVRAKRKMRRPQFRIKYRRRINCLSGCRRCCRLFI